ncbi:MAG: hypothetical protein ACI85K_003419 [Hyphomicrobiaceae bacterium]|jgi:hypothetical protein
MTGHALRRFGLLFALALLGSCTMHERAVQWNGHVGPDGEPVFVLRSTYVGMNFGILLPILGDTDIGSMIKESTSWIGHEEGTHLRLIETETDNFWYGAPPLTWLFTPIMTNMTIEYRPTQAALARENVSDSQNVAQPPR